MKHFWFVLTAQTSEGKLYAVASPFSTSANLAWEFDPAHGTITANICETKKRACEIAEACNETFRKQGKYAF